MTVLALSAEPCLCRVRSATLRLALTLGVAATLAACSTMPLPTMSPPVKPSATGPVRQPELLAFRARLSGAEVVPPSSSLATGELVAVLNIHTGLLQWKLNFAQLSGPVQAAHFHSPAMEGEVALPVLAIGRAFDSPYEGRAMLTPVQRKNLQTGQWYVNLRTARFPDGEIRGQLIEQR